MECEQTTGFSNHEFLQAFNKKAAQQRIPLSGTIELTHRCNLGCRHCYVGEQARAAPDIPHRPGKEFDTRQWKTLIDEITAAGCLYLLITGGEPLLRKDFDDIYRHAAANGLLVTVFTNGTLIDEGILELFTRFPPRLVEVTLYGATRTTYERVTRVKGSYEKCLAGINALMERKINVRLKTMLMTLNRHEFFDIEKLAGEWGVRFRFDAALFPGLDGDKSPLGLRVTPEEAVEKEFSDEQRAREYRDFFARYRDLPETDRLYSCGAGLTHFHIDPYGGLRACLMVKNPAYDLIAGDFHTGWNTVISRIRGKKLPAGHPCISCLNRSLCGFCPGFFELENGKEDACSRYLCSLGHLRFEKITEMI
jgi:MoaA/NifB/PqqE/SkfB family radical SAM enzyme